MKINYTIKPDPDREEYNKYILDNPTYPHTFEFWKTWDRSTIDLPKGLTSYKFLIFDVSASGSTKLQNEKTNTR